jgi:hypothetical protein
MNIILAIGIGFLIGGLLTIVWLTFYWLTLKLRIAIKDAEWYLEFMKIRYKRGDYRGRG